MEEKKGAKPTERVVLMKVEIKSDGLPTTDPDRIVAPGIGTVWYPVLGEDGEVRIFHATSKKQAIEQYAGKKGKDHPGTYRAPSLSAWREEHTFKPSDEPLMVEEVKP